MDKTNKEMKPTDKERTCYKCNKRDVFCVDLTRGVFNLLLARGQTNVNPGLPGESNDYATLNELRNRCWIYCVECYKAYPQDKPKEGYYLEVYYCACEHVTHISTPGKQRCLKCGLNFNLLDD